jgi:hypothetical protein
MMTNADKMNWFSTFCAVSLIVACRVIQLIGHPDLTEAQALKMFWPGYLVAVALLFIKFEKSGM